jgi:outer membrane protein OmpA-like peptidoglycan-associated protein
MLEVQKKQKERDEIFEEFKATKEELFNELDSVFKSDFQKWEVKLDKDLSIKFTNPDVLFKSGATDIRPKFENILNSFLPRYLDVIMQEKYKDKIAEIRIEGHTDIVPAPKYDRDPYVANIILSQRRSAEVVKYLRQMSYFNTLPENKINLIEYLLTANGLSYGRTVDENGELTIVSNNPINNEKSRRVEFRIITTSDKLVERVLNNIQS